MQFFAVTVALLLLLTAAHAGVQEKATKITFPVSDGREAAVEGK